MYSLIWIALLTIDIEIIEDICCVAVAFYMNQSLFYTLGDKNEMGCETTWMYLCGTHLQLTSSSSLHLNGYSIQRIWP